MFHKAINVAINTNKIILNSDKLPQNTNKTTINIDKLPKHPNKKVSQQKSGTRAVQVCSVETRLLQLVGTEAGERNHQGSPSGIEAPLATLYPQDKIGRQEWYEIRPEPVAG